MLRLATAKKNNIYFRAFVFTVETQGMRFLEEVIE